MAIDCITGDSGHLLRIRGRENGKVDFEALATMMDGFLHNGPDRDIVLSFPPDFVASGPQIGHLMLWGGKAHSRGGNLGIVTANDKFRERLFDLVFAVQIRIYRSEDELEGAYC